MKAMYVCSMAHGPLSARTADPFLPFSYLISHLFSSLPISALLYSFPCSKLHAQPLITFDLQQNLIMVYELPLPVHEFTLNGSIWAVDK